MKLFFLPQINVRNKSDVVATPKIRHYIGRAYQFGEILVGCPYTWNEGANSLELGSWLKQGLWWCNMALAFLYSFFVYGRCAQIAIDPERSSTEKIYMRVMAAYMTLALILHITTIKIKDVMPPYINRVLRYAEVFEERYLKESPKVPMTQVVMGLFLQGTYLGINSITALMTLNAVLRPYSPEQPASLMGENMTLAGRVVSVAIIGLIEYIYHASSYMLAMPTFSSVAVFVTIISELGTKTCALTKDKLRTLEVKLRIYKELRLFLIFFNQTFNSFFLPALKFIGIVIVTFGTYALIRMRGIQSFALGFLGSFLAMLLLLLFGFMAELHYRSSKLLLEWGQQLAFQQGNKRISFRKELRALTPLKAVLSSTYFVDRRMVLTLGDILVLSSVNFLLVNR